MTRYRLALVMSLLSSCAWGMPPKKESGANVEIEKILRSRTQEPQDLASLERFIKNPENRGKWQTYAAWTLLIEQANGQLVTDRSPHVLDGCKWYFYQASILPHPQNKKAQDHYGKILEELGTTLENWDRFDLAPTQLWTGWYEALLNKVQEAPKYGWIQHRLWSLRLKTTNDPAEIADLTEKSRDLFSQLKGFSDPKSKNYVAEWDEEFDMDLPRFQDYTDRLNGAKTQREKETLAQEIMPYAFLWALDRPAIWQDLYALLQGSDSALLRELLELRPELEPRAPSPQEEPAPAPEPSVPEHDETDEPAPLFEPKKRPKLKMVDFKKRNFFKVLDLIRPKRPPEPKSPALPDDWDTLKKKPLILLVPTPDGKKQASIIKDAFDMLEGFAKNPKYKKQMESILALRLTDEIIRGITNPGYLVDYAMPYLKSAATHDADVAYRLMLILDKNEWGVQISLEERKSILKQCLSVIKKDDGLVKLNRGVLAQGEGKLQEAITQYQGIPQDDLFHGRAQFYLALCLLKSQDPKALGTALRTLKQFSPKDFASEAILLYRELGSYWANLEKYELAARDLRSAIALAEEKANPLMHNLRASLVNVLDAQAHESLKKSTDLMANQGWSEAEKALKLMEELLGHIEKIDATKLALPDQKNLNHLKNDWTNPDKTNVQRLKSFKDHSHNTKEGKFKDDFAKLSPFFNAYTLVDGFRGLAEAGFLMADLCVQNNNTLEAFKTYMRIRDNRENSPRDRARACALLGDIYHQGKAMSFGEASENRQIPVPALDMYKEALALDPNVVLSEKGLEAYVELIQKEWAEMRLKDPASVTLKDYETLEKCLKTGIKNTQHPKQLRAYLMLNLAFLYVEGYDPKTERLPVLREHDAAPLPPLTNKERFQQVQKLLKDAATLQWEEITLYTKAETPARLPYETFLHVASFLTSLYQEADFTPYLEPSESRQKKMAQIEKIIQERTQTRLRLVDVSYGAGLPLEKYVEELQEIYRIYVSSEYGGAFGNTQERTNLGRQIITRIENGCQKYLANPKNMIMQKLFVYSTLRGVYGTEVAWQRECLNTHKKIQANLDAVMEPLILTNDTEQIKALQGRRLELQAHQASHERQKKSADDKQQQIHEEAYDYMVQAYESPTTSKEEKTYLARGLGVFVGSDTDGVLMDVLKIPEQDRDLYKTGEVTDPTNPRSRHAFHWYRLATDSNINAIQDIPAMGILAANFFESKKPVAAHHWYQKLAQNPLAPTITRAQAKAFIAYLILWDEDAIKLDDRHTAYLSRAYQGDTSTLSEMEKRYHIAGQYLREAVDLFHLPVAYQLLGDWYAFQGMPEKADLHQAIRYVAQAAIHDYLIPKEKGLSGKRFENFMTDMDNGPMGSYVTQDHRDHYAIAKIWAQFAGDRRPDAERIPEAQKKLQALSKSITFKQEWLPLCEATDIFLGIFSYTPKEGFQIHKMHN